MGGSRPLSSPLLWRLWKLRNPKAAVPVALPSSCSQLWELGQLWLHDSGGGHPDRLQMQPPHLLCRADGGYHLPSAPSILPTVPSLSFVPLSPQVSSPEISYLHRDSLSIITYIGCLISALASISTIFFLYFRYGPGAQWADRSTHAPLCLLPTAWRSWQHSEGARMEESRALLSRNLCLGQVSCRVLTSTCSSQ